MAKKKKAPKNRYRRYRRTLKVCREMQESTHQDTQAGKNPGIEEIDVSIESVMVGLRKLSSKRDAICRHYGEELEAYGVAYYREWDVLDAAVSVECMLWERLYGEGEAGERRDMAPLYIASIMWTLIQQVDLLNTLLQTYPAPDSD